MFFDIGLDKDNIKDIQVKEDTILVFTKLIIDLNGIILSSNREKRDKLSNINRLEIKSVQLILSRESCENMVKKGCVENTNRVDIIHD